MNGGLSNGPQVSIGITDAMLQLPQGSVVVMQPDGTTDLGTDMRWGNVLRQWIGSGHRPLSLADRVHPRVSSKLPLGKRHRLSVRCAGPRGR